MYYNISSLKCTMKNLRRCKRMTLNVGQHQSIYSRSERHASIAHPKDSSIPDHSMKPRSLPNDNTFVPPKIDYSFHINKLSSKRPANLLREICSALDNLPSTCIKFGIGVPNVLTFPFTKVNVELITGEDIEVQGEELSIALQYLPSIGYRPLINILEKLQDSMHGPQNWENRAIMVTSGAQDALSKAVDMLMSFNDPVLLPDSIYPGAIDLFKPYDAEIITMKQDSSGVIVEDVKKILVERKKKMKPIPKIIYLNPTASNPSGTTLTINRKREIYQIACEYNILILEDDPYYYLHFGQENPVSLMSMDTDGRVLRFDSFSKIMSSGIRVGFITGPKQLVRQMELHMQTSTIHASSLSQMLMYKLLSKWGINGFTSHTTQVKQFYKQKRDHTMQAVEKELKGLAEWYEPTGGMFLWLKIIGLSDTKQLVTSRCLEKLLVLAPGYAFATNYTSPSPYIRISYSIATPEEIYRGISILAESIREELKLI